VLNDQIHFAISIPVVVAFMLCHRVYPSLCWLYGVPLLVAVQLLFTYALCLLVATLNVFFRDLERLTAIFTMILFYLTPIFYPATMIPAGFRWAFYLNPVAAIITAWRGLFLEGTVDLPCYGLALGFALAAFAVAQAVYGALEWRLAELV
jgi:lipopolysaccharide transport system permease protein